MSGTKFKRLEVQYDALASEHRALKVAVHDFGENLLAALDALDGEPRADWTTEHARRTLAWHRDCLVDAEAVRRRWEERRGVAPHPLAPEFQGPPHPLSMSVRPLPSDSQTTCASESRTKRVPECRPQDAETKRFGF